MILSQEAKERNRERVERIQKEGSILELLSEYGYKVHSGVDREQQFPCDMHGDGFDSSPSARVYPLTNSWFCFACGESRDLVGTVMAKEGLSFAEACYKLESFYDIPHMYWEPEKKTDPRDSISVEVSETFDIEKQRTERLLELQTQERVFPLQTTVKLWEVFDRVCYHVHFEQWNETKAKVNMAKLRGKVMDLIRSEGDSSS